MRLSQRELAGKLGVSPGALSDWEAGRHKPIKRNLEKLKNLLKNLFKR